jgi:hypothetical protein
MYKLLHRGEGLIIAFVPVLITLTAVYVKPTVDVAKFKYEFGGAGLPKNSFTFVSVSSIFPICFYKNFNLN